MGTKIRPIDLQAANFFKVIALAVTLNEYYSYLKDDLIKMEVEAYGLRMKNADRNTRRKMERDFERFVSNAEKSYSRLPKLLDSLENAFAGDYDKEAVDMFIDVLHEQMNKIEAEVVNGK